MSLFNLPVAPTAWMDMLKNAGLETPGAGGAAAGGLDDMGVSIMQNARGGRDAPIAAAAPPPVSHEPMVAAPPPPGAEDYNSYEPDNFSGRLWQATNKMRDEIETGTAMGNLKDNMRTQVDQTNAITKDLAVPHGAAADAVAAQAKIDALTKGSMSDYGYDEALAQHTGGWSGAKPREQSWASGGWESYGMPQEEKDKMLDAIQRGGR